MESRLLEVIEEQISVQFTGKVNILNTLNRQFLGHLLFRSGDLVQATFLNHRGLKAFYQIIIQEFNLNHFTFVVEPEIVDEKERQIHYPWAVLKLKMADVLKLYKSSLKLRPPEDVKILIDADFLSDTVPVTSQEFDVLEILTEHHNARDVYQYCGLLDHEITMALVGLRKKGALKLVAPRKDLTSKNL